MHLRTFTLSAVFSALVLAPARADDKETEKLRREVEELRKQLDKEREVTRLAELVARENERKAKAAVEEARRDAQRRGENEADEVKKSLQALKEQTELFRKQADEMRKLLADQAGPGKAAAEEAQALRKKFEQLQDERQKAVAEAEALRAKLVTVQTEADLLRRRSQALAERIAELERADRPIAQVNPGAKPPADLHGTVMAVSNGLVVINLGADAGLVQGQKLEVVRIGKPEKSVYLGAITIVRLEPKQAVGRFEGRQEKPKPGDEVFSRIDK